MGIGLKIITIILAFFCGIVGYYLFLEMKKEYVKQEKVAFIKDGIDKIQELQALKSAEHNQRIEKISQQIAVAETVIESLEHHDIFC